MKTRKIELSNAEKEIIIKHYGKDTSGTIGSLDYDTIVELLKARYLYFYIVEPQKSVALVRDESKDGLHCRYKVLPIYTYPCDIQAADRINKYLSTKIDLR